MNKRVLFLLFWIISIASMAQTESVIFSANGGFYPQSFQLSLGCYYSNHHIRFTTDGNTPDATSRLYEAPLELDERLYSGANIYTIPISPERLIFIPDSIQHAIVIRAAVFDENEQLISPVSTQTYLINELGFNPHGLPVVSICADSLDLFDYETGILVPGVHWDPEWPENTGNYFQRGKEWERMVNVEFYEPNNSGINQLCGLRTHGHISRIYQAKGLKIYAREEYGKKRFKHRFFEDTPINSFKHLVLKPYSTGWPFTGVQSPLSNKIARKIGLDAPCTRLVTLFINGEYWGLYFLQEKLDERYIEDHYDYDSCNLVGNWYGETEFGEGAGFIQMMDGLENALLSEDEPYQQLCRQIDVDNFIDYMIYETYISNTDWPGNNMRCWQADNGPWRWLFFDGDQSLINQDFDAFANAVYTGTPTWCNNQQSTLMFRRLLENDNFKKAFSRRLHELCNGPLQYDSIKPFHQEILDALAPSIHYQTQRFGYPESMHYWDWANSLIDGFLRQRTQTYLDAFDKSPLFKPYILSNTDDFVCYPNPSNNEAFIKLVNERSRPFEIVISDALGRVYYHQNHYFAPLENLEIGTMLNPGFYIIKVGTKHQRFLKK